MHRFKQGKIVKIKMLLSRSNFFKSNCEIKMNFSKEFIQSYIFNTGM